MLFPLPHYLTADEASAKATISSIASVKTGLFLDKNIRSFSTSTIDVYDYANQSKIAPTIVIPASQLPCETQLVQRLQPLFRKVRI